LITGHSSVKYDFANGVSGCADRDSFENTSVFKGEYGWYRQANLLEIKQMGVPTNTVGGTGAVPNSLLGIEPRNIDTVKKAQGKL